MDDPGNNAATSPISAALRATFEGAELNGEGGLGYFIHSEWRSITVAVKCRVAAVTTCCINSSCCDRRWVSFHFPYGV